MLCEDREQTFRPDRGAPLGKEISEVELFPCIAKIPNVWRFCSAFLLPSLTKASSARQNFNELDDS